MGMISGTFATIENQNNDLPDTRELTDNNGDTYAYLNIDDEFYVGDNTEVKTGLIVESKTDEVDDVEVNGSNITVTSREIEKKIWTRYWIFPQDYVVVQNKSGEFAFKILESITGGDIEKIEFDLAEIVRDHPGQWMGGFEERNDNVESGTLYGEEIEYDGDIGQAFLDSNKNQIGPRISYNNIDLKIRVGDSWFQVTSPGNYTRQQHLEFFNSYMADYIM
ncbi:hypothetical protein [Natronorubrum halophilum]|uniref:hypothetical protein n=1 Tax=Natronorubrum halophilum TaxID=1702106 RepID=UPI0010C1E4B5|nr:hypothetical protein [Natronorubrum halophilum]